MMTRLRPGILRAVDERATLAALMRKVVAAADRDRLGLPESDGTPW